jgi:hypothetical protein
MLQLDSFDIKIEILIACCNGAGLRVVERLAAASAIYETPLLTTDLLIAH